MRQVPRRWRAFAGAVGLLLLAGVLFDSARAAPPLGMRRALLDRTGNLLPGQPIRLAMVLQLEDCSGNLRALQLANEPAVRERIQLTVLWYVGPVNDSARIRPLLPAWTAHTALAPAPRGVLKELHALGHRHTPVLIAFDQEGRIRLTTQSPRSLREFAGLRRILDGLTWIEEL